MTLGRAGAGGDSAWPLHTSLLDHAALGMALVDTSGRLTYANPALHRLLGATPGSLRGLEVTELASPDAAQADALAEAVSQVLQGTGTDRLVRLLLADSTTWADLTVSATEAPLALVQVVDVTGEVRAERGRARAAERFSLLSQMSSDVVARLDEQGVVTWVSPAVERVLGWEPAAMIGQQLAAHVAGADRGVWAQALAADPVGGAEEVRVRSSSGSYRFLALTTRRLPDEGSGPAVLVGLRDVTEEHRAKDRLARSEAQFRTAMQGAPEGIAVTDLHDRIVQANPALAELLGRPVERLVNHRFREFTPEAERDSVDAMVRQLRDSGVDSVRMEHGLTTESPTALQAEDGLLWVDHSVAVLREDEGTSGFVHQFADRTAARRLQDQLRYEATHDMDTGLEKRHSLMSGLEERLGVHPPAEQGVGVLWVDIDHFKSINDEYGHRTGDRVIAEVAERLRNAVRQHDRVGRMGGDEFVVVLEHCESVEDLRTVAEHLRAAVSLPVEIEGLSLPLTLSVGAILAEASSTPDQVLTSADMAMYRAKRAGGNRLVVEAAVPGAAGPRPSPATDLDEAVTPTGTPPDSRAVADRPQDDGDPRTP